MGSSGEALEAFVAQQVGTATEPDLDQFVGQWVGSVEAFISGFLGSVEADWKPSLHPRGPDGKFIDSLAGLGISDLIDEHGLDSLDSVSNVVRGGAKSDVDLGELGDRIAEERSGGYIARAVKEAAEAEEIDVDGFDANARLVYTHDAKEFPQEAQERFAESVDQDELETVEESVGKWELDFFAENMAPMWQAAMEDTGNPNLLNDEERVSDVDVPDADLDAIRKQKEHAVETMREIHGDTVTVYRAFQGDPGQKLEDAAEAGESIDMDRRALESYTTELSYAKGYVRGQRGAVIKREIDVEQIWASSDAGFLSAVENEVVVGHDSVETIEPDDILTHADLDDGATNVELIGGQIRDLEGGEDG